jgi:lipopolysaccharide export system permease protein
MTGRQKPFGQLDRLLLRELSRLFFATLGGVVVIYLVIDFADRAHGLAGPGWARAAAELYANKAAVIAYQLAPAALIIAAALLVTQLSRRGELIGLFALGVRPLRLALPLAGFSALLGAALFLAGEKVVVRADARAEEINTSHFGRWGDWGNYHHTSSWVRGKEGRIFHLGPERDGGWEPVRVLEIAPPFRIARMLWADRIEPSGDGRWRLIHATERRYGPEGEPGGAIEERHAALMLESFPETASDLMLRSGRPRQLPWGQLREQLRRRHLAGQRFREYEVTLAERAAQPVQVVPAALAAMGLTLRLQRPRRRMPLAGAVALGIALSLGLWAVSVVSHALSISGSLSPWLAGCVPAALSALVAGVAFRRG